MFTCNKIGINAQPMRPMEREFDWMDSKYGVDVRPWHIAFEYDNNYHEAGSAPGQFSADGDEFTYSYTIKNTATGQIIKEREPMNMGSRLIDMQAPNEYRGELAGQNLGSAHWHNTDQVWNVNGCIFLADGNFNNPFFFKKIGRAETPKVALGSYPSSKEDFIRLRQSGYTAVLNVMNNDDTRMHGISSDDSRALAQQAGIKSYAHSPVTDNNEEVYVQSAF